MRAKWLVVPLILFSIGSIAFTKQDLAWIKAVKGEYGERAGKRVSAWRNLIEDIENQSENEKLEQVNRFFNQLYFVDDIKLWGKKDYWATPLEFLGSNAGDCEDFTIAKYFSLL